MGAAPGGNPAHSGFSVHRLRLGQSRGATSEPGGFELDVGFVFLLFLVTDKGRSSGGASSCEVSGDRGDSGPGCPVSRCCPQGPVRSRPCATSCDPRSRRSGSAPAVTAGPPPASCADCLTRHAARRGTNGRLGSRAQGATPGSAGDAALAAMSFTRPHACGFSATSGVWHVLTDGVPCCGGRARVPWGRRCVFLWRVKERARVDGEGPTRALPGSGPRFISLFLHPPRSARQLRWLLAFGIKV